jgi:hypothetical protein
MGFLEAIKMIEDQMARLEDWCSRTTNGARVTNYCKPRHDGEVSSSAARAVYKRTLPMTGNGAFVSTYRDMAA